MSEREPAASDAARELARRYEGAAVSRGYVAARFESELHRVLHERQVAAVQRAIDESHARRVLELAPGPARVTRDLRVFRPVVCLERSAGMIEEGRRAAAGRTLWARGDAFSLPFRGPFDLVYGFRFVRHFRGDDRARLYDEIRRVLAPNGTFVMDAVNRAVSAPLRRGRADAYPIYDELYDRDGLAAELAGAGLPIERLEAVQRRYRWQYRSQVWLGPRAPRVNRWLIRALERWPREHGLEWIVTCRRA